MTRFRLPAQSNSLRVTIPVVRTTGVSLIVLAMMLPAARTRGADEKPGESTANTSAAMTVPGIESRIARLRDAKNIEVDRRDELAEIYKKTIEAIRAAEEFVSRTVEYTRSANTAPGDIEKAKAELATLSEQTTATPAPTAAAAGDLTKMQQALTRSEADRDHRRREVSELEEEADRRTDRRREIAERDEEIDTELREVNEGLDRERNEDDELDEAQKMLLAARRRALLAEQEMHRQELLAYEATADLIAAQRDLAATRLQAAEDLFDAWQKVVNDFRRSEADRQHSEALRCAASAHPLLRPIAERNVELAAARKELASWIEETSADSETATSRLEELREQFEKVTERARRIGFTEAVGILLRKQRDSLAVIDESLRNRRARAASVAQMSALLTDYEEQRAQLADLNSRVRIELKQIQAANATGAPLPEAAEIRELLASRKQGLDALIRDTTRYVEEMMELESVERQLVAAVREFTEFSDEHILWIRSAGMPQAADFERLTAATRWLTGPVHWQNAGRALYGDALAHKPTFLAFGAIFAALVIVPWRLRRLAGRRAGRRSEYAETVSAFLSRGLAAARWPIVVAFVGSRLTGAAQADDFVTGLGHALINLAWPLFLVACVVRIVTHKEVASLFQWSAAQRSQYRNLFRVATALVVPLLFALLLAEAQYSELSRNTIGRLAFVLLMLVAAELARRLWGIMEGSRPRESSAGASRLSRIMSILHVVTIAAPVVLIVASIGGYHFTALQFARRSVETAAYAAAVCLLTAAVARSARRNNRSLSSDASLTGMEPVSLSVERENEAAAADSAGNAVRSAAVSAQVQRLVQLASGLVLLGGILAIWSGIFPFLKLARSVAVWPLPMHLVDPALSPEDVAKIVTLAGLLAALGITALTFAAARNVRGVLELTLLRYVALDAGARYAVSAICRYLIALAGLLAACGQVGIGASQLNWLVAAMTVGLGFGLQEIFANFVSGLILLFERPVRIGDIVSVEGTTGTVSRIRIRATTITDGDMRELIVPNKELITGRVINWTLSNTVARMTISVRTAHGVDPDKARGLLLNVASQHPLVLRQPPPQALFDEFSDKTQNFTLRVFMANCDVYPQLRHELLTSIQRTFRQAGIGLNSSDAASLPVPVPPPEQRAA